MTADKEEGSFTNNRFNLKRKTFQNISVSYDGGSLLSLNVYELYLTFKRLVHSRFC